MEIILFGIGLLLGITAGLIFSGKCVGTLRVDTYDDTYFLYLEMNKDISTFKDGQKIVLKTDFSQK